MINRLKELRFYKEKTQLQVQMETGIEQALLSKYENGVRIPPTDTLMILADYYGVSMDYIMGRTDNPKVNR
ncbi:MAG: helix-turn-helix transcriptional regulator [Clostridia bacterium]|jgi:transcriptional regulator with XRE-family HTH domain|nr:helix-turn-helix transcriptional regulator [Clostridia bacterium]